MSTFNPTLISYKWDRENFEKAFLKSYTHQFKNSARRYVGWFFVALAQFGVVAALKGGSVGLLMLSSLLIFYWYVVKKWLIHRRAVHTFENSPLKDTLITLRIDEKSIQQEDIDIAWQDLQGLVPIEDDILLYHKERAFYIPANAFASYEERSALKTYAKERGKLFHV